MFITDADSLWPEGKLSDLIEVCYGKDHKKLHDGDIPVYGSGGIMRHVDRALYEQESVLVPRKGHSTTLCMLTSHSGQWIRCSLRK